MNSRFGSHISSKLYRPRMAWKRSWLIFQSTLVDLNLAIKGIRYDHSSQIGGQSNRTRRQTDFLKSTTWVALLLSGPVAPRQAKNGQRLPQWVQLAM